jgi:RNA polymerase sigma-70 factor (ECF subfamily)
VTALPGAGPARRAAERAARESYGRLVAFLASRSGDVAAAEDALAQAFAAALRQWPVEGVPERPEAWLHAVAKRRQVDELRRHVDDHRFAADWRALWDEALPEPDELPDRRAALLFACAQDGIEPAIRAPLMLQTVLGLTATQIAEAFLMAPATLGQRLVRAKARIKRDGLAFRLPDRTQLPARVASVLDAVYAAYAKGWSEPDPAAGVAMAEEAIWLATVVAGLLPDEPEAQGVLSLMLYAEARRPARTDAAGDFVPLSEQDVTRWDARMIQLATRLLHATNDEPASGRFQVEAAIQSAQVSRRLGGTATADDIVRLYDLLATLAPSPVVRLNRAMAIVQRDGPAMALPLLDELDGDERMATYQPYWAARASVLAGLGLRDMAQVAFRQAIGLSSDAAVRSWLQRQSDALGRAR